MIEVLYFARLREQLDCPGEGIDPAGLQSVADLIGRLRVRGGAWEEVFAGDQPVLMAVNQEMADPARALRDGDEVAFFPPVTGG
ncbi:MAG: MoaD/ThiS family protein [Candidatus Sedimenticola endophacoides]